MNLITTTNTMEIVAINGIKPQTAFFDVPVLGANGTHRLAVHEWGKESAGETIFCVHGLTRNARDFDILAIALAEADYRVLCLDVAGRGESQWLADPSHYSYPDYVSDILSLIPQIGLKKVHYIGTSMGGIIGMMLSNSAPQFIGTLTLNDVGCTIPAAGMRRIGEYVGKNIFASRQEAEEALRARCCAYGITEEAHWQHYFTHGIEEANSSHFRFRYDPAIAVKIASLNPDEDINLWPLWEGVKAKPTLLIHGEESDILTEETARQMQQSHPDLTLLEVPDVGHAPHLADATQINAIKTFVAKHKL